MIFAGFSERPSKTFVFSNSPKLDGVHPTRKIEQRKNTVNRIDI
nr:unnamed protein product [Callosobruchus analis]